MLMTGNGEDSEQDNADGEKSNQENGESPIIGDDTKWCKPLIRIMLMTGNGENSDQDNVDDRKEAKCRERQVPGRGFGWMTKRNVMASLACCTNQQKF